MSGRGGRRAVPCTQPATPTARPLWRRPTRSAARASAAAAEAGAGAAEEVREARWRAARSSTWLWRQWSARSSSWRVARRGARRRRGSGRGNQGREPRVRERHDVARRRRPNDRGRRHRSDRTRRRLAGEEGVRAERQQRHPPHDERPPHSGVTPRGTQRPPHGGTPFPPGPHRSRRRSNRRDSPLIHNNPTLAAHHAPQGDISRAPTATATARERRGARARPGRRTRSPTP